MKFLKQFGIILVFSFIGELLNHVLPLPVPASIYGIILMFTCLKLGFFPLSEIEETGRFLIEIMPLMFIPAAVGLLEAWDIIRSVWILYLVVTIFSTIFVMAVSGMTTQYMIRYSASKKSSVKKSFVCQGRGMWLWNFLTTHVFFGVLLSLLAYGIGALLKQKFKLAIFNPLLIAVIIVIAVLAVSGIDYKVYNEGAKYISYLLTPATICLAIPLYEQFELLKSNWKAIAVGIFSGVLASLGKYSCHGSPIWIYASGICIISSKNLLQLRLEWMYQKNLEDTFPSPLLSSY